MWTKRIPISHLDCNLGASIGLHIGVKFSLPYHPCTLHIDEGDTGWLEGEAFVLQLIFNPYKANLLKEQESNKKQISFLTYFICT